MELSEKEKKELKRFAAFNKSSRKVGIIGGIISIIFGVIFIGIGIFFFIEFLPKFSMLQSGGSQDFRAVYTLWCYTFVLLGFSTILTGYLLLNYSKDIHFLFTLYERAAGKVDDLGPPRDNAGEKRD